MEPDLIKLKASLAKVQAALGREEVVNYLRVQLADPAVVAKIANLRIDDTTKLANDTVSTCHSFDDATVKLQQVEDQQWASDWKNIRQAFVNATKQAIALEVIGNSFFSDFNSKVVDNLDWAEENWEAAIQLIKEFIEKPDGDRLDSGSQDVSQAYTDNRRLVTEFKGTFSSFVLTLSVQYDQSLAELQGDITALNAELARYQSLAAEIERALWEIAGIPWWMTWLISEILELFGITSAEEARKMLDLNYAQQQAIKAKQDAVRLQEAEVQARRAALESAQSTLLYLTDDVADIDGRLNEFASEWAQQHHDIILVLELMQAASDSATKRALITRLKLLGSSVDALLSAMQTYVQILKESGLFN
ncbi:hypothetical protein PAXRUDRAFT_834529 [Paxillus rubicundulus Ve08.2h10]|uniref:Uncharacterized protein n=1 Tax=Paxillus rubicundulus Ve08.2h10 TaxID=930991 RepID=A0A0D0C5V4_9AGAM|nr:hypothetical protein PAXRUDRAFT_834529 [Paxillus rubicundulus Ve08.2h10]